jgi:hypothetical protein
VNEETVARLSRSTTALGEKSAILNRVQPPRRRLTASEAGPGEVLPAGIVDRVGVERPPLRVLDPRPRDDRFFGVKGIEVRPRLSVAVPQNFARDRAANRSPYDSSHIFEPAGVEPDHLLCAAPNQFADKLVAAFDDPIWIGIDEGADPPAKFFGVDHAPIRLVRDAVEFEMWMAKLASQCASKRRLSAARVTDHAHSLNQSQLSDIPSITFSSRINVARMASGSMIFSSEPTSRARSTL